jgi:tRNA(Ile2) C34 agmatinyltransferase TiaS
MKADDLNRHLRRTLRGAARRAQRQAAKQRARALKRGHGKVYAKATIPWVEEPTSTAYVNAVPE